MHADRSEPAPGPSPFTGTSEMAGRMRQFDWSRTPVGPVEHWPHSLRTAVSTLLECQLPMYIAWGPDFTQFYNDAYRPILGAKHPQALGESTLQSWPEIWPTIGPMWQQVLAGEAIGFDDFKLTIERFGYPEDCYFNFSYSPVRDDAFRAAGVLVTFAETTRRVLAEQRLRFLDELAQATRALAEPADVMTLTAERLGRYLGANRCAYAHVHADEDTFDLVGNYNHGVDSIVGRYRFTDFGAEVQRLMTVNQPYVNADVDHDPVTAGTDLAAYRYTQIQAVICVPLHKNGRFVAAMAVHQSVPRHWTAGEIELVQTVVDRCWDSLERLRAEAALREEARSLEVLNRTGEALSAELELDALLQRVTDAATELTGARFGAFCYLDAQAGGAHAPVLSVPAGTPAPSLDDWLPPSLAEPTFRGAPPVRVADLPTTPTAPAAPTAPTAPSDEGRPRLARSYLAVPVVARSGEVVGGLFFGHPAPGMFTERSERLAVGIAAQAAIAIDNARLYARAQQAAHERELLLASERAARVEAERAGTVKDQFLATLSHELRTPLSAITGWAYLLRRKLGPDRPELLKGLEVIDRSAQTQVQLIDDLLDMSRITAGKLSIDLQPVQPAAFVQAALDLVVPSASAAGVGLVVDIGEVGPVQGDAHRLQQAVWNLLTNAVKFTPRGGEVRLSLRADDGHAEVSVADTGVGIPTDFLPHAFERFRQADGSITRQFGGLGLGLSIVQNLVALHGGSVHAHSEGEGRGACFTVRLPLMARQEATAPAVTQQSVDAMDPSLQERLRGARVLVVDDDADARELLSRVLRECGAHVVTADGASQALQCLQREACDLLVSDIGMPDLDGYELLKAVRRLPPEQGGRVPAVALTAFVRQEDRARALDTGYAAHLSKPVDPSALLACLARLLPTARQPGAATG